MLLSVFALATAKAMPFYAVRIGKVPGIYSTWAQCLSQVHGYSGAIFKKFPSKEDALKFIGDDVEGSRQHGYPGGKFKKFSSQAEKFKFIGDNIGESRQQSSDITKIPSSNYLIDFNFPYVYSIYTDGSCKNNYDVINNKRPAGWGVVVLKNKIVNREPVEMTKVEELYGQVIINNEDDKSLGATVGSNNTGELSAIGEALLWLLEVDTSNYPAIIYYDSEYAANSVLGRYNSVKNLDLIRNIQRIYKEVKSNRNISFVHVKGHSADVWNDRADELANMGASQLTCQAGRYASKNNAKNTITTTTATTTTDIHYNNSSTGNYGNCSTNSSNSAVYCYSLDNRNSIINSIADILNKQALNDILSKQEQTDIMRASNSHSNPNNNDNSHSSIIDLSNISSNNNNNNQNEVISLLSDDEDYYYHPTTATTSTSGTTASSSTNNEDGQISVRSSLGKRVPGKTYSELVDSSPNKRR